MLDGSTGGRAFESAAGFWFWIILVVIVAILWLFGQRQIRCSQKPEDQTDDLDQK